MVGRVSGRSFNLKPVCLAKGHEASQTNCGVEFLACELRGGYSRERKRDTTSHTHTHTLKNMHTHTHVLYESIDHF